MAIVGHKPSGFLVTENDRGNRVERETRQCVHCGFTWIYEPGSKRKYGFCLKCYGVTCGKPECNVVGACEAARKRRVD